MSPSDLQGLATRWLANLPGRDSHPLDYTTLPGRTSIVSPEFRNFPHAPFLYLMTTLMSYPLPVDQSFRTILILATPIWDETFFPSIIASRIFSGRGSFRDFLTNSAVVLSNSSWAVFASALLFMLTINLN